MIASGGKGSTGTDYVLEAVFFYIGNVEFSIAPFVFEGFLALALFFIFFLALDAKPREGKDL